LTLVLDASVALTWLFPDEHSELGEQVFRDIYATGAHAPVMLPIEVGNGLNVGLRRGRLTVADWHKGISVVQALPMTIDEFMSDRMLSDVTPLAQRYELSVYDAMYLELASRLGLPLATFDRGLSDAAEEAGVQLWSKAAASIR
jgi:predicted nucleic acid-binding protein